LNKKRKCLAVHSTTLVGRHKQNRQMKQNTVNMFNFKTCNYLLFKPEVCLDAESSGDWSLVAQSLLTVCCGMSGGDSAAFDLR